MLRSAWDLLTNPAAEIYRTKREKNWKKTFSFLIIDWILIAIGVAVFLHPSLAVVVFFGGIAVTLFMGLILRIISSLLHKKSKYFESLTSLTYTLFPIAIASAVSSIYSTIANFQTAFAYALLSTILVLGIIAFYRTKA